MCATCTCSDVPVKAAAAAAAEIEMFPRFSALEEKASRLPETHGELYYNSAYVVMLVFILPIFFSSFPFWFTATKIVQPTSTSPLEIPLL